MPLLLCPNCNTSMQNVSRSGVDIDMCPSCRGVWLDRGELEKLLEGQRAEQTGMQQDRQKFEREVEHFHRDPDDWKRRHAYDSHEHRYKYDDDYHYRKKKKKFDIFDIFD
ncbi:MAG: zf-TFIIB domain-containing protein [Phenylobacterium sp.]|uniref:TFIIB-type zinc ribbon-containing protein n=1 Tax=Phenylobacterium sp. TaxID=1871053 RepID=UPI001A3B86BC|nr:zf-TFIIB domain-containing protein [Phenylobacterium sp.]MBL8772074.1 zf-TFIIB domain-containing protein [Phenylobacterium sp.]